MSAPTDHQAEFKQRLAIVLEDLKDSGMEDGEAMFFLGNFATRICDSVSKAGWTDVKNVITRADYDRLLKEFETEGNRLNREGNLKAAYALQALALSLVARTQADPQVRSGEALLDIVIDSAIGNYRKHAKPKAN